MKKAQLIVTQLCLLLALLFASTNVSAESIKVKRLTFPVTLSDNQTYNIVGYLYYHGSYKHRPLQVLLHGSTYNHAYWDFPRINGHDYSYARHMAKQGYAVLAIDQLGTGESDAPDGDFLTVQESALGLHQVMTRMRTSAEPLKHPFHQIILVGHSLGSITAIYSEGTYGDADALVITGQALAPHPLPYDQDTIAELLASPYPTLRKEVRASILYDAANADPAVIAYDNDVVRDNVARGQLLSALALSMDPVQIRADLITEPVLVQLGDNDVTAPSSLGEGELGFYAGAESVTVKAVPEIGHDLNLHVTNKDSWAMIEDWLDGSDGCDD